MDVHIGARIRLRRTALGLSQEKLGGVIGLSFQAVQKYERGTTRIGATRLYELSSVLDVPVSYFYEGFVSPPPVIDTASPPLKTEVHSESHELQRDTLALVRAFASVKDRELRQRILNVVKALAGQLRDDG
jgi:transcriptional regulator with XRE-family HTH domain